MLRKYQQFQQVPGGFSLFVFLLSLSAVGIEPPATSELDSIQVEGTRAPSPAENAGANLGGQRIEMQPDLPGSVSRNLIRAPSVSFRKWGNDEASQLLSLRGQDPTQTRLYLNGFPLGDGVGSGLDTRWVQPRWMSHALILPNGDPMTLLHESLGGAVDMRLGFGERVSVHRNDVGLIAGSFGTRGVNARLDQSAFGVGVDARMANDDFAYRDSAGTLWNQDDDVAARRQNNEWRRFAVLPWYSTQIANANLRLFGLGGWEERKLPGVAGSLNPLEWKEQLYLMGAGLENPGTGFFLRGYGRYRKNEVRNLVLNQAAGLAAVPGKSQEIAGGVSGGLQRKWGVSEFKMVLGADREGLANQVALGGGEEITGRKDAVMSAVSLQGHLGVQQSVILPLEWNVFLPFAGTVGYEAVSEKRYLLFSPRWTTQSTVAGVDLHSVVGYFQKSPGLYDLYGDARGLIPNPKLLPERAFKAEVGVDWPMRLGSGRLQLSATSSWSENSDLLTRVSMGPSHSMSQNIGRSRIIAEEISAMWSVPAGWRLQGVGQLLLTTNLSPAPYYLGKELPYRSRWRWSLDLEKQWATGFSVGYLWQWQSGFFADQLNSKRLAPFQEHSLRARYNHREWGELTLELLNLLDATTVGAQVLGQAQQSSPTGMNGYPYPGRRAYVTWNYPW